MKQRFLGVKPRFYHDNRAELCRLELPDLNTERRTLHIRQGKGKKDRVVPVGERALFWVERYLQEAARACA